MISTPGTSVQDIWKKFAQTPNDELHIDAERASAFRSVDFDWDVGYKSMPLRAFAGELKTHGINLPLTGRKPGEQIGGKMGKFAQQGIEDLNMNRDIRREAGNQGWQELDADVAKATRMVARNGSTRSYVLYGVSGVGKSYGVYKTLQELGYQKDAIDPKGFIAVSGALSGQKVAGEKKSGLELLKDMMFRYADEDSPILVLDDFDIDFTNDKLRATFLGMFETNEEKGSSVIVGVNKETGKLIRKEFYGRVIIISNKSNWPSEILDRFGINTYYNITSSQLMDKIQFLAEKWGPDLPNEVKSKVFDMIMPMVKGLKINIRRYETLIKALEENHVDGDAEEELIRFAKQRILSWAVN